MNIYDDYLAVIKEAVSTDSNKAKFNESFDDLRLKRSRSEFRDLLSKSKRTEPLASLNTLQEFFPAKVSYQQKLGCHPDFAHLRDSTDTEEHYVVSAFVDIKGSTNPFKKFDKETVFLINNAILSAGIHTALIFGGYIHRLQGDGLFIYFGNKSISKEEAVQMCLRAVSLFTYFVKYDLQNFFSEQGIENISVRSGIDLGNDEDVLWGNSGIENISEITTCSLHTNLACKMQGKANSNGIVIGQNVKDSTPENFQELFTLVSKRTEDERDRYIFRVDEKKFFYSQYDFDWFKFVKKQDFIATDLYGNPVVKNFIASRNISAIKSSIEPIAVVNKPYFK
jgi:adenylate cyclase